MTFKGLFNVVCFVLLTLVLLCGVVVSKVSLYVSLLPCSSVLCMFVYYHTNQIRDFVVPSFGFLVAGNIKINSSFRSRWFLLLRNIKVEVISIQSVIQYDGN